MPTQVDVPGIGIVEFPDGMTSDQISTVIQRDILKQEPPPAEGFIARTAAAIGDVPEAIARGYYGAKTGLNVLGLETGLLTPEEAAANIAASTEAAKQYPMPEAVRKGMEEIQSAQGWKETGLALARNLDVIPSVLGESIPASAASIGTGLIGGLLGAVAGPVGATAGLSTGVGVGSAATEYASSLNQFLTSKGVNTSDPDQLKAAFSNPELMSEARNDAATRGIAVGAFDALSAGIAGRLFAPVKGALGGKALGTAAGTGAEITTQAAAGAGGEATAQLATEGEITSPGAVALEAVGEIVPGIAEAAISKATGARTTAESLVPPTSSLREEALTEFYKTPGAVETATEAERIAAEQIAVENKAEAERQAGITPAVVPTEAGITPTVIPTEAGAPAAIPVEVGITPAVSTQAGAPAAIPTVAIPTVEATAEATAAKPEALIEPVVPTAVPTDAVRLANIYIDKLTEQKRPELVNKVRDIVNSKDDNVIIRGLNAVDVVHEMIKSGALDPKFVSQGRIIDPQSGEEVSGGYMPSTQTIRLNNLDPTSNYFDPIATTAHEAVHHLDALSEGTDFARVSKSIFTPLAAKWEGGKDLISILPRSIKSQFGKAGLQYLDTSLKNIPEGERNPYEIRAYLIGARTYDRMNGTVPQNKNFIGRVLDFGSEFVERFANKISGVGWTSAGDTLNAISSGKLSQGLMNLGIVAKPQAAPQVAPQITAQQPTAAAPEAVTQPEAQLIPTAAKTAVQPPVEEVVTPKTKGKAKPEVAPAAPTAPVVPVAEPKKEMFSRAAAQTGDNAKEFQSWWKQSKIADTTGEPIRYYHGTFKSFKKFDKAKSAAVSGEKGPFFFSPSPRFASDYAFTDWTKGGTGQKTKGGRVSPVFLSVQNPFDYENTSHVNQISKDTGMDYDSIKALKLGSWRVIERKNIQDAIRKAGFDGFYAKEGGIKNIAIFDPKQVKSVFNEFVPGTAESEQFSRAPATGQQFSTDMKSRSDKKFGVYPYLRTFTNVLFDHKRKIMASVNSNNAALQIQYLNELERNYPNPMIDAETFATMESDALGSSVVDGSVPLVPYNGIRMVQDPTIIEQQIGRMSPGQQQMAEDGFKLGKRVKAAYVSGKMTPTHTAKLMLWGLLSRGVSPFIQESAFLDVVTERGNKAGVGYFIQSALDGNFNKQEYLDWTKMILPEGSPGNQTKHNLNGFGESLIKLTEILPSGKTLLKELHDMIADYRLSGKEIRRRFHSINTGIGINNKVLSFMLLVSGRNDVVVLDRVQMRNLFNDGRFDSYNLYDGEKIPKMVKNQKTGKTALKDVQDAGTAMNKLGDDTIGLMYYEAIERGMKDAIKTAYNNLGRGDGSPGQFHWESWVATSAQEVDHGSIEGILRDALGVVDPYYQIHTRQGKYNEFTSGMIYGYDRNAAPYVELPDGLGNFFRFTPTEGKAVLEVVKEPKNGIIPPNFRVSQNVTGPWYNNKQVNKAKLNQLYSERGTLVYGDNAGLGKADTDVIRPGRAAATTTAAVERAVARSGEQFSRASAAQIAINAKIQAAPIKKDAISQFASEVYVKDGSLGSGLGGLKVRFIQGLFDYLAPLKLIAPNAYKKFRIANNSASIALSVIANGPIERYQGGYRTIPGAKSLVAIVDGIGDKYGPEGVHLWTGYMAARRSKRLILEGRESLMTQADIDQMLDLVNQYPEFETARKEWVEFNDKNVDFARENGTITAREAASWKANSDFIPFYRALDDDGGLVAPGVGTLARQSSMSKKLKGSDKQLGNLLENMILNTDLLIRKAIRNDALRSLEREAAGTGALQKISGVQPTSVLTTGKSIADEIADHLSKVMGIDRTDPAFDVIVQPIIDATDMSDAGLISLFGFKPNMDKDVMVVRGPSGIPGDTSTKRYYKIKDPLLVTALTFVPPSNLGFMRLLTAPKTLFTRAITMAPPFMAANLFRDTLQARVLSNAKTIPFFDTTKGLYASLRNTQGAKDLQAGGGSTTNNYDSSSLNRYKKLTGSKSNPFMVVLGNAWGALEAIGNATEVANRIAIREAKLKSGASLGDANFEALDIMDFSLRGSNVIVNFIISTVPFMNARLQGMYKLGRAGFSKENRANFLLMGSMFALASLGLAAMNEDDERYQKETDVAKDNYIHIYLDKILPKEALIAAGIDKWTEDFHIALPKPFEIGAIFMTIPERMYGVYNGTQQAKDLRDSVWGIVGTTFKMHPVEMIPYPAKIAAEQIMNVDLFRKQEIVPEYKRAPGFAEAEYKYNTPEVLKAFSQAVKDGTGIGISPLRAEKLIRDFAGTFGEYFMMAGDMAYREMNGMPQPINKSLLESVTGASRFVKTNSPAYTKHEQDFYNLSKDIKSIVKVLDTFDKESPEKAEKFEEANAAYLDAEKEANKVSRQLADLRTAKEEIYREGGPNAEAEIKEINAEESEITKEFMVYFRELEKEY